MINLLLLKFGSLLSRAKKFLIANQWACFVLSSNIEIYLILFF